MKNFYNVLLQRLVKNGPLLETKSEFIETVKGTKEEVDKYLEEKNNKEYPNLYKYGTWEGYFAIPANMNKIKNLKEL